MDYPLTVPSYVQGYRFSDAVEFYDSGTKTFRDTAGYGAMAALTITSGNPVFTTIGGFRGLTLNNTFNGSFRMPIPWMGSAVIVVKPVTATGSTTSRYPLLFGNAVSASSNGQLRMGYFSGTRSFNWQTVSSVAIATQSRNDDNLAVYGFATDQETRRAYSTADGVAMVTGSAISGTTNGNGLAMQAASEGVRFGDMDNDPANLTEITDFYCNIFELHFFADNIWINHATEAAALMAALRTEYGVA